MYLYFCKKCREKEEFYARETVEKCYKDTGGLCLRCFDKRKRRKTKKK
jgi:hypothetical protein